MTTASAPEHRNRFDRARHIWWARAPRRSRAAPPGDVRSGKWHGRWARL